MKIIVVGLGYVGLPLAIKFAKYFSVAGYDISKQRVSELQEGNDRNNDVKKDDFIKISKNIKFRVNT